MASSPTPTLPAHLYLSSHVRRSAVQVSQLPQRDVEGAVRHYGEDGAASSEPAAALGVHVPRQPPRPKGFRQDSGCDQQRL